MKLSSMLSKESILQLDGTPDKWSIIRTMVQQLARTPFCAELDPALTASFYEQAARRENIGATGLGEEIAFPHARLNGLERPLIAFATLRNGVDFDAPDGRPARLVFLFLLPASRVQLGV